MNKPIRRFYVFDSFRVDANERQLWQGEQLIPLAPKVFDVLLVLLENRGTVVEKHDLIARVWPDTYVEEGSLNRNISTLRRILGDDSAEQRFVKTLPKRGYQFTANVEEIVEGDILAGNAGSGKNSTEFDLTRKPSKRKFIRLIFAICGVMAVSLFLIRTFGGSPETGIDLSSLTENERRQLAKFRSADDNAIEHYVKGRSLWHQRSAEALHLSITHLESAVKSDPGFALAHAALADAYAFDAVKWKMAEPRAREAIRLNPALGEPYATIGFVRMFWDWKSLDAGEYFRTALELSPGYATAHQWYAINLVVNQLGGAALAEIKRANELEPNSLAISADLCQILYLLRKYDDAIVKCNQTLEKDSTFLNAHVYLYEIYTAKEMNQEAVEKFFQIEQLKSDFTLSFAEQEKLRKAFKQGGIRAFWQARIEYLQQSRQYYDLAKYCARHGEKEKALIALKNSFERRDFDFILFQAEPVFSGLHNEAEFREFVDSMKVTAKSD